MYYNILTVLILIITLVIFWLITKTKGFLPEFTQFYKREMTQFNRHALHAASLQIIHPKNREKIIFKAPLPLEYLNLITSFESFYER